MARRRSNSFGWFFNYFHQYLACCRWLSGRAVFKFSRNICFVYVWKQRVLWFCPKTLEAERCFGGWLYLLTLYLSFFVWLQSEGKVGI